MQGSVKYKVLVKRNGYNNKTLKIEIYWKEIISAYTKTDLLKKVNLYFNTKRLKNKK